MILNGCAGVKGLVAGTLPTLDAQARGPDAQLMGLGAPLHNQIRAVDARIHHELANPVHIDVDFHGHRKALDAFMAYFRTLPVFLYHI